MATTSQAIVPLDKDNTDGVYDLVSRFSRMKIGRLQKSRIGDSHSDGEEEDIYIYGEKVINHKTFHKYLPNILASLRKGNTITIVDNRSKSIHDFSFQKGEDRMLPVPYKADPLSRLCDENTVISYDDINHIIKLWDLRKNYSNYHKQPCPRSIIYLSKQDVSRGAPSSVLNCDFKPNIDIDDLDEDIHVSSVQNNSDGSKKYSLNYVLTWPESLPSVVVTYPDAQKLKSTVIIEELSGDNLLNKAEILPLTYKPPVLKRKNLDPTNNDTLVSKKSIITCIRCGKGTSSATFCDSCNWTDSKRKYTEEDHCDTKRLQTSTGLIKLTNSYKYEQSMKTKRKLEDDSIVERKRLHIDIEQDDRETNVSEINNERAEDRIKCDQPIAGNNSADASSDPNIVNLPEYTLNNKVLNSVPKTGDLDWKSKLRIENCQSKTAKITKVCA